MILVVHKNATIFFVVFFNAYPFILKFAQEKTRYLLRDNGFLYGAGYRSRTGDLLITSQLLYQLS